jgi:hypothetical protein
MKVDQLSNENEKVFATMYPFYKVITDGTIIDEKTNKEISFSEFHHDFAEYERMLMCYICGDCIKRYKCTRSHGYCAFRRNEFEDNEPFEHVCEEYTQE